MKNVTAEFRAHLVDSLKSTEELIKAFNEDGIYALPPFVLANAERIRQQIAQCDDGSLVAEIQE